MPTPPGRDQVVRIGVSGHRDLHADHVDDLREAVEATFETLTARIDARLIEVVTGMADGADQLVADVAAAAGCRIRAALPKPLDVYRDELSTAGRERLDAVVADPDARITTISAQGETDSAGDAEPYVRLGTYLARSSHILLALWDGDPERKPGGTSDVLSCFLDGTDTTDAAPTAYSLADMPEGCAGPVAIWIPTTRREGSAPATESTSYLVGSEAPGVWYRQAAMPDDLDTLLAEFADMAHLVETSPDEGGYPLVPDLPGDIDPELRAALGEIHDAYLDADRLAIAYQSRSDRAFVATSLIAAAMGFSFLWFAKIDDHLGWLYAYLILFIAGFAVFVVARAGSWLRRHLSFRALAETLRVRFFVTMLSLESDVAFRRTLDLSGVSSLPGFKLVGVASRAGIPSAVGRRPSAHEDVAREHWVDGQAAYFERRSHQLHRRHARLELVERGLYGLAFVAAVAIVLFGSSLKKSDVFGDTSSKTFIVFLMGLLPLWLTFWELHQNRMATRELQWQFRNQERLFRHASNLLGLAPAEARRTVYIDLAEQSLFETYLWTLHRFHREFSPPSGG